MDGSRQDWRVLESLPTLLAARLRRRASRFVAPWAEHPSLDLVVAAVIAVGATAISIVWNLKNPLGSASQSQRLAVYAAGAGAMSLIGGFAGTAIAQYGSSAGPIVTALRATHGAAIRRNWLSITTWLLIGTVVCLLAMTFDAGRRGTVSVVAFEVALSIAVMKFARLVFLFSLILTSADAETTPPKAPRAIGTRLTFGSRQR